MSAHEIQESYASLTKHPRGSVRELWVLSIPLMFSALSENLMMFCDRIILAHYSLSAMNAAASVGMSCGVLIFGLIILCAIAEVFVGKRNGAKDYKRTAEPVWQMLWLALSCSVIFLPLSYFAAPYLVPDEYIPLGNNYYHWLMSFGSLPAMITAVSSFFVGRGKTKLVLFATISGNLVNLVLDMILIFGVKGIVPSLGIDGAAIATVVSLILQFCLLMFVFLNRHHRQDFNTHRYQLKLSLLRRCLAVGLPSSIGHMIEFAAWATMLHIVAAVSSNHITVLAIGQSIFHVLSFLTDGLQKGVIAVAANFIGAKHEKDLTKVLFSGVKLQLMIVMGLILPLIIYPDLLIDNFLASHQDADQIRLYAEMACLWVWFYFLFDGLTWVVAGLLTAYEDTVFIMIMNAVGAWCFAIMPLYAVVVKGGGDPASSWMVMLFYAFMNLLSFSIRYGFKFYRQAEA